MSADARTAPPISPRSEDYYRQLLDAAPDAVVVVGTRGVIELVNLQTEKLFGYARGEIVGQPFDLLIPERFRVGHGAHVARYLASPSARVMGSGLELWGRRKDGVELPIEVSLSPLTTAEGTVVSAAIRDISARKELEARTKLVSDRLASAVESIQDAFALFDREDRLVLCNSVYRRLIGNVFPGPVTGETYARLLDAWLLDIDFPSEQAREAFRAERLARRAHDQTATFDLRMRDGRSLRVIDRRTAEGGTVKTIWDLTDDVRIAEELRTARAAADAASTAKSEFLASMSHELRTPLNAILGFAQLMQRDKKEPLGERHQQRAKHILKGGEHLLRLIDDILDLARIEAGGVPMSIEPVDVRDVIGELETTLGPMATTHGIRIEASVLPENLPLVAADRTRLTQILMNFGSNGIKYNRPKGKVRFTAVSIPGRGRVRIAVRDDGIGIPMDKQDKLFQPFQRAGQETGSIQGTGIGLVVTKRLAQLMQGDVGFASVPGDGSEFWLDLPIATSQAQVRPPELARRATGEHAIHRGRKLVLYVEDNPANVAFMQELMSTLDDVDLVTAPTAEIGIELAPTRRPDVIIMDINLPGVSGSEALKLVRAAPDLAAIPVIALTAAASERDVKRGIEAGFFRYLTKPVQVDELIGTLEGLLGTRA